MPPKKKTSLPVPTPPPAPLGSTNQKVLVLGDAGDYERTFDEFTDPGVRSNTVIVGQATLAKLKKGQKHASTPLCALRRYGCSSGCVANMVRKCTMEISWDFVLCVAR